MQTNSALKLFFRSIFLLTLVVSCSFQSFAQETKKGTFTLDIVQRKTYGYAIHIPKNTREKEPLLVFLHGDGEKGTDIEKVKIHGPFQYLLTHELDAFVLAPQCPENETWDTEVLYNLILRIQKEYNVDPNRIYVTGLSSGGWATFNLALSHPDFLAAIVPISSFVDLLPLEFICKIKAVPIHMFHGLLDDVVPIEYPTAVYKELKKCDANIHFTIFDDANHNSWTRVYDNATIYEWMFQQIKKS